jgi:alpha-L-rhamnosidase
LENYALADKTGLPEWMIPMCYPADGYPQKPYRSFIPNWTMWYILELEKYAEVYGEDEIIQKSRENVFGILKYFQGKENEFGVLEDLEGWVFIEWSAANEDDHIRGVNVPSNIIYAASLRAAARLYGQEKWNSKADRIERFLKENAYNGKFFVDNLVRNDKGELVRTNLLTEVCQYYAFWFRMIKKEEYPELYEELMEHLGTNRKEGYLPEVAEANVIYGLYMRIDLLMREGKRDKVLEECLKLFLPMAERTGTLWEHHNIKASCDHGFASYSIKWIMYATQGTSEGGSYEKNQ